MRFLRTVGGWLVVGWALLLLVIFHRQIARDEEQYNE